MERHGGKEIATHNTNIEKTFPCSDFPYQTKGLQDSQNHALTTQSEIKPFKCSHCSYSSKTQKTLNQHCKIHDPDYEITRQEKKIKCPECSYETYFKSYLQKHLKSHTGEKLFSCSICPFQASQVSNLNFHMSVHHIKEKSFTCPFCDYAATVKNYLTQHIKSHTLEKPYRCKFPNCEYAARTASHLKYHSATHIQIKSFKCPHAECRAAFVMQRQLNRHAEYHNPKIRCPTQSCQKLFPDKSQLKAHMTTHSKERPFSCPEPGCGYSARIKGHLTNHLKTNHSDDKPYKCTYCEYRGKTRTHLNSHLYVHPAWVERRQFKIHSCSQCPYKNIRLSVVQNHERKHFKRKSFKCHMEDCEYEAATSGNLKSHLSHRHTKEKKYSCNFCGFRCVSGGDMNRHIRVHTNEKPYKCRFNNCQYVAAASNTRSAHEKTHKGESIEIEMTDQVFQGTAVPTVSDRHGDHPQIHRRTSTSVLQVKSRDVQNGATLDRKLKLTMGMAGKCSKAGSGLNGKTKSKENSKKESSSKNCANYKCKVPTCTFSTVAEREIEMAIHLDRCHQLPTVLLFRMKETPNVL